MGMCLVPIDQYSKEHVYMCFSTCVNGVHNSTSMCTCISTLLNGTLSKKYIGYLGGC